MKYLSLFILSILAITIEILSASKLNVPKVLSTNSKNVVIGLGSAAALTAFKIISDGPVFNEPISLLGKDVVITGGNTGLGKESAVKLASLGARVIILCRPSKKSDDAVIEIKQRSGNNDVKFIPVDLSDLSSIRKCAKEVKSELSKLDVLMNNAGVMAIPERQVTKDGFEMQMGINHLGHFALTNELLGLLKKAPNGRLVSHMKRHLL